MTREIVVLSPDALGYKDRGKMKWMGMMLSDHAEALKRQKKETISKEILPKEKQPIEQISTLLFQSYAHKKPLAIQLDTIQDGKYLPDIQGFIIGFNDKTLYIKQRDHSIQSVSLDAIRHVEWINSAVWYEKYDAQRKKRDK
ncbi:hypothetical protein GCM10008932_14830 [Alkalibacterium iburiense]|uniref:YolD-like protein n=1 Tax=Alkalibacterium iburiense TaxID=290589 RepID=A0ABN0XGX8_9LACT